MKQAVIFDPRHNDIWMNLARSYRGARRFREAHAMYDHALTIAPRTSAILAEKAEAFFAAGDLDAAERLFGPEPPPVESEMYDDYLDLFYLRRDFERAIALHRHAIDTLQDTRLQQSTQLSLAYILVQIGRVEEARPTIDIARREVEKIAATGDQSLWIRDELLALAAIQGDREVVFREAESLLQMTAKDRWRFPISHESIARAYVLLGEFDRAIPHLEQTLAMPSQQGLTPAYLQLEAFWDPIRNHPRFQKLTRPTTVKLRAFFGELKRRNVYRVAVAYAVVAWLLIQIATSTFPVLRDSELGHAAGDRTGWLSGFPSR